MHSWVTEFSRFQMEAKQFDPSIKLKTKDNTFSYIIAWILYIISFTKITREKYLKETATAIGNIHYYPKEWTVNKVERVMPHEARHTYQARWFGFGSHPMAGLPLMAVVYFLLPIPIYFAFGRFLLELDADKAKYRYMLDKQGAGTYTVAAVVRNALHRLKIMNGPLYVWAMNYKISQTLYLRAVERILNEYKT